MRELTDHERKIYQRLRRAFRRAGVIMQRRGFGVEGLRVAVLRITRHAETLGWLR